MTDRGLRRAELLHGLEVQLGQPPLSGESWLPSDGPSWRVLRWLSRSASVECWRRQDRYSATTPPLPTAMLSPPSTRPAARTPGRRRSARASPATTTPPPRPPVSITTTAAVSHIVFGDSSRNRPREATEGGHRWAVTPRSLGCDVASSLMSSTSPPLTTAFTLHGACAAPVTISRSGFSRRTGTGCQVAHRLRSTAPAWKPRPTRPAHRDPDPKQSAMSPSTNQAVPVHVSAISRNAVLTARRGRNP